MLLFLKAIVGKTVVIHLKPRKTLKLFSHGSFVVYNNINS